MPAIGLPSLCYVFAALLQRLDGLDKVISAYDTPVDLDAVYILMEYLVRQSNGEEEDAERSALHSPSEFQSSNLDHNEMSSALERVLQLLVMADEVVQKDRPQGESTLYDSSILQPPK